MYGHDMFLASEKDDAAAELSDKDLVSCDDELFTPDFVFVCPGGGESGFIGEIAEVGARPPGHGPRDVIKVNVFAKRNLSGVDLEDLDALRQAWKINRDLPIKAARAQQGRVKDVRPIGGGDDDDVVALFEAVDFGQELVEGLLAFVVAAAETDAAMASNRIEFINENDRRGAVFGGAKEVTDAGGAHADKHFHELRATDAEKRDAGFSGDGAGEKGLSSAGRPNQENTFGYPASQARELGGGFEKGNHLLEFLFGFFDAGHVFKCDGASFFLEEFGMGLSNGHQAA